MSSNSDDEFDAAQPARPGRRLRANDREFLRIPIVDHSITINEIHASVIGVATGAVAAIAWLADKSELTVLLVFVLSGYAVLGRPLGASMSEDDPEYCDGPNKVSIAVRTIRHEPWYFLAFMIAVLGGILAL